MTNDNTIVRLLYSILKQKCLKDVSLLPLFQRRSSAFLIHQKKIDWNKVAADHGNEITNGHAARMRYSRFKKQMDGTPSPRKPRNTNSPRKKIENKVPKREKVKTRNDSDDAQAIKEEVGVAGSSHYTPIPATPEPGRMEESFHGSLGSSPFVKREPDSSNASLYASTPLEESTTPASSFHGGANDMSEHDDMYTSFGMPNSEYMAEPMIDQSLMSQQQYGISMHMGMGHHFQDMWEPQQIHNEGGVMVKREPRWEHSYSQI